MIWMVFFLVALPIAVIAAVLSARKPKVRLGHLPEHFVIFDLETTGLDPLKHEIIEIGAIRVNRDSIHHDAFQVLVKPRKKVPKKITELTGISQEMVDRDGVPLPQALEEFRQFVGELRLVSFNAKFDMAFIGAAIVSTDRPLTNPVSCALVMARRAWPGRSSYRLKDLARDGNLDASDTHRALADCKRALIVYTASASTLGSIE